MKTLIELLKKGCEVEFKQIEKDENQVNVIVDGEGWAVNKSEQGIERILEYILNKH